jgi:hypothetical protein
MKRKAASPDAPQRAGAATGATRPERKTNDGTFALRQPRWARPPAARTVDAMIAAAILALVLAAAACGGSTSSSAGPSSAGAGPSPAGGGGASSAFLAQALAFARCVRAHGIPNFPDPDNNGTFSKAALQQLGVSASRLRAAENTCPLSAGPAPLTAQDQRDYLRGAACMRSHGIINFPDPVFSEGRVSFRVPASIDTRSARFTQARQICARLIPAGLPYSSNASGG